MFRRGATAAKIRKNRSWKSSRRTPSPTRRAATRLGLEPLEDRRLLSLSPQLIEDINPGLATSNASNFVEVGGTLYFTADDGIHGFELWKSDGTAAGTSLVLDIFPGSTSSSISQLFNFNGTLYFAADNGVSGRELWTSDGTPGGTFMVKDIVEGAGSGIGGRGAEPFAQVGDHFYMRAGNGLWKSDGTTAGTQPVREGIGSIFKLTESNGKLFFRGSDTELWISDGTGPGTFQLKDIYPGTNANGFTNWGEVTNLTDANGTLYFQGRNDAGRELWKSDGTAAGTVMVADINPVVFQPK